MPSHNTKRPFPLLSCAVAVSAVALSSSLFASAGDPLLLLGTESTVLDRAIASQELLSHRIDSDTSECEVEAETKASKKKKEKDRAKTYDKKLFKCIDKALKGYQKSGYIDKDEKKALKTLLKSIEKGEVTPMEPGPNLSLLDVRVTQPDGAPVMFISVTVADDGTALGQTSGAGTVSIETLEANSSYVLRFSGAGYADQIVPITTASADQALTLNVTMIAQEEVALNVSNGMASANGSDGSSVSFEMGSFIRSSGEVVSESDINVSMTPVDVSNRAELNAFPGEFVGVDGSTVTTIASLGTVEFEFTMSVGPDGTEEPLNLAPGSTATIEIPIYFPTRPDTMQIISEGSLIPLWSLNEETGKWDAEGQGMVVTSSASPTGYALQADVSHFSWWNCDVSLMVGNVVVSVAGSEAGVATVNGVTEADLGWRSSSVNFAQSVGTQSAALPVPANTEVCYSADITYISGASGTTNTVCRSVGTADTLSIDLQALDASAVLTLSADAPTDVAGDFRITEYINNPVRRLRISPVSVETAVSYSVTGSLPSGVQLITTGAASAEIAGTPTQSGIFNVQVVGNNADGETDSVDIVYDISTDVPPVEPVTAIINGNYEDNSFNLNDYTDGPAATSWALTGPDLPVGMQLDSEYGEVFIGYDRLFDELPGFWDWTGLATGTTASGSIVELELTIRVLCDYCGPYAEY